MSKEPQSASGRMSNPQNAISGSTRQQINNSNANYQQEKQILESSQSRMPVSPQKENVPNLITGKLKRPNSAKKHLLYQTYNMDEVLAAETVWNNPQILQWKSTSALGDVYDANNPVHTRKIAEKQRRGVVDYQVYKAIINGMEYEVKTENIGNKYERLYHLRKIQ